MKNIAKIKNNKHYKPTPNTINSQCHKRHRIKMKK